MPLPTSCWAFTSFGKTLGSSSNRRVMVMNEPVQLPITQRSNLPLPCVLHEDEHLLVVNKPAGWNTHSPSPYAGEGIYDWLKHREPRWASLAIIHRLDKETSGVMVFSKSTTANHSLTEQFTDRKIRKRYQLLTDRTVERDSVVVESSLVRSGEKYLSRPVHAGSERAETHFKRLGTEASGRTM